MAARLRFPLLALGIGSLFCGVWAGLLRFGWSLPAGRANLIELHGPLMVFGFLGTVISLERAVALGDLDPGVLANAGGVVVSYFEWVQGLQEYFWKEVEVNAKLNDIVSRAFDETWETAQKRKLPMRVASYGLAVQRVAEATVTRGIYP